ncbi:gamma carbonic anhydrase family protein [Rhodococcus ruber]|uniref:gamma carbonic anhydrase family protein n=1 Tax=Rhodococcus ruber TaxID=1830 RepID=UPI000F5353A6|nr:gamma carbonic anhydrase family protein [Rhodococcus ruber]RQM35329.1 gamma carbonic anhydrase family protein [Rhodococcus ruber]
MTGPHLIALDEARPEIPESAWLASTATVVGSVHVSEDASIWYGAVLRADSESIMVGAGSNVQDNVAMHVDPGYPLTIGANVSIGHNAVLHGCTVGDDTLVGMGAVILNGARIGSRCLVAAGALVLEGAEVPPRSLVAGVPAKVRRALTDDEIAHIEANARNYRDLSERHRAATSPLPARH